MKTTIITTLAAGGLSVSAFAQGSLVINTVLNNDPGVTTGGLNAASTTEATTWFTGTVSLEVFALASATDAQLNAINSYLNTVGGDIAAFALLQSDGFVEVSTTTVTGSTVGAVAGAVSDGYFAFNPPTVGLSDAVTTDTTESLALFVTAISGTYTGWSGVIAFNNNTGGNINAVPPGTPAELAGWGALDENLVLSPTPEPTTTALAALGSVSLLLFRHRK